MCENRAGYRRRRIRQDCTRRGATQWSSRLCRVVVPPRCPSPRRLDFRSSSQGDVTGRRPSTLSGFFSAVPFECARCDALDLREVSTCRPACSLHQPCSCLSLFPERRRLAYAVSVLSCAAPEDRPEETDNGTRLRWTRATRNAVSMARTHPLSRARGWFRPRRHERGRDGTSRYRINLYSIFIF
jgi:hypothetical protein